MVPERSTPCQLTPWPMNLRIQRFAASAASSAFSVPSGGKHAVPRQTQAVASAVAPTCGLASAPASPFWRDKFRMRTLGR